MYIIYQTRNIVNNKIYIGVHNGKNKNYLGSGMALQRAIKTHGRENFERTTLEEFETREEAYSREQEIVNEEFIKREDTYNCQVGGWGGNIPSEESKSKMREAALRRPKEFYEPIARKAKERLSDPTKNGMYGKTHSDQVKKLLSNLHKGKTISQEHRESARLKNKGRVYPTVTCPHCGKEGRETGMKRWHFNNCRSKL